MSSKAFSLLVSLPGEEPSRHDLNGEKVTIGRGPDNDIQVLISEVSVKHGEFRAGDDGFSFVDIGSTNGSKVNGAAASGAGTSLSPMDKILLGETISAYFVPTAVLDSTPVAELIESIENSPKATPGTAPIAVAAKPAPGVPPAAKPAPGVPPAAKPAAAVPAAVPAAVAPAAVATPAAAVAPGAATVRLDQVKPGAAPGGPVQPPAAKPAPVSPGAPKIAAPAPAAPAAPAAPGAGPAAPKPVAPVPLKRPDAGAAQAPSVPLPKSPPKPGG
ncbi:MAG: FHA domain-containing protein [Verrucomicrobiota bacterium]